MNLAYVLHRISFSYSREPTLVIDNLEIRKGELIALRGSNGAGKTTLLHVLAFINIPQHGTVHFFQQPYEKENLLEFRRRVGLLLQHPYLFKTTVIGNIVAGLRLRGVKKTEAIAMARQALDTVGLSGFENRSAQSLSGGEAQRVALARTLVLDPDVLLLDEPWSHMDTRSTEITEKLVLEINKTNGKTVVVATHDVTGTRLCFDRICLLDRGHIRVS
mgnify:CR=1 FL=1